MFTIVNSVSAVNNRMKPKLLSLFDKFATLWIDASNTSSYTLDGGSNITSITDLTGKNGSTNAFYNNMGGTATITNSINGFPTISLKYCGFMGNHTSYTGTKLSFFCVIQIIAVNDFSGNGINPIGLGERFPRIFGMSDGSTTNDNFNLSAWIFNLNTLGPNSIQFCRSITTNVGTYTVPLSSPNNIYLFSGWFDGTNLNAQLNGGPTPVTGAVSGPFNINKFFLNTNSFAPNSADTGNINRGHFGYGECINFTTNLSTTQRQQVEGYLSTRWGLRNKLPNSHPYNSTNGIAFTGTIQDIY